MLRWTVLLMMLSLIGVGCFHVHYQQTWIWKTSFYSQLQYLPLQQWPLADIWESCGMHLITAKMLLCFKEINVYIMENLKFKGFMWRIFVYCVLNIDYVLKGALTPLSKWQYIISVSQLLTRAWNWRYDPEVTGFMIFDMMGPGFFMTIRIF